MKKLLTLIFAFVFVPVHSQWIYQTYSEESLNDIYCVTEDIVTAVGNAGKILKTIDGGAHWLQKISNTSHDLFKVAFVNSNIGYAVGSHGSLLKTLDGGETWTSIPTGITNDLFGLSCLTENAFFISGRDGLIMKTEDGGMNFESISLNDFESIQNIKFFNDLTGYASSLNALYKTIDGGVNWSVIHSNYVFSFFFLNENVGFINASDGMSKTINGGTNFNYIDTIDSIQYKLFATTENVVWGIPVGCLLNGDPCYSTRVEITESSFQREDYQPTFQAIHFVNPTTGYAIGYGGSIYKNSTGTLAINQINRENEILVFPNPSSENFTITFPNKAITNFSVKITDGLGQIVFSKSIQNTNETTVNTSSFAKGIYFLSIEQANKIKTQKLLVD
ncbi:T9SS type A sorting domain-containing protein [Flavobacterium sp. CYK-55]|uniref:WD40/YVTN/BNR-like repeat-containing protein n=1 Tax=Flavobacterium sp. CYK-55 TaxID=2835529 RepID=UPI001BCC78BB|nr:T9SS type A sorting domain-containing protein [Flavobacterium sp. CYK-55]MBS7788299.1 T9SS type A sorting domain-containing protein [Flavobacterium sp. CYK-55]